MQRLQVKLMLAIQRGGLSLSEADRHLLRQFCRGCWNNALISEFQLEQRKTDPPPFSELLLLLRTAEDRQSTKELRKRKHLGASKQRASSYSLCVFTDEAVTTQAIVSDLKKQITELQSQVESLKKAKEQTKGSHENMTCNLQRQVVELQSQFAAVKPAKSEKAKSAEKLSKSQYVQTSLGEFSQSISPKQIGRPKPWYCFQCGEDGHIAASCNNVANPALVASKRKLLKERQSVWKTEMRSSRPIPLK